MAVYLITYDDGRTHRVNAREEVLEEMQLEGSHGIQSYELVEPPPLSQGAIENNARMWRDEELSRTDAIVSITDHPRRDAVMAYRQTLRDWPSTDSFPESPPTIGE